MNWDCTFGALTIALCAAFLAFMCSWGFGYQTAIKEIAKKEKRALDMVQVEELKLSQKGTK